MSILPKTRDFLARTLGGLHISAGRLPAPRQWLVRPVGKLLIGAVAAGVLLGGSAQAGEGMSGKMMADYLKTHVTCNAEVPQADYIYEQDGSRWFREKAYYDDLGACFERNLGKFRAQDDYKFGAGGPALPDDPFAGRG
jgi:hypothetical protein